MSDLALHLDTVAVLIGGIVAVVVAIRRAEKKLREEIARRDESHRSHVDARFDALNGWLQTILESLPYPAWVKVAHTHEDGRTTFRMKYVNTAYERAFGVTRSEYVGQSDFDIWPAEIAAEFQRNDLQVLATQKPERYLEAVPETKAGAHGTFTGGVMEFEKAYIQKHDYSDGGTVRGVMGFMRPPLNGADAVNMEIGK